MIIRNAAATDLAAIDAVLRQAFPGPEEANLVRHLYRDGDVVLALVAEMADQVVGTVLFSRMGAPFPALGLAPLAVVPERQRQGIAASLIRKGLELARDDGWEGVFVLGDPDYYTRFGFTAAAASGFNNPYAGPYLMALSLGGGPLPACEGKVDYAKAFAAL